jgi:UDPglucose--hexose-1-phosphate uridylyltransferase
MPEFRRDLVNQQWTIIAENRSFRPSEFVHSITHKPQENCPFCRGFEQLTPGSLAEWRLPGQDTWQVRAVPNKFPALISGDRADRVENGIFQHLSGIGRHEVIIETPKHEARFAELEQKQQELIITAYRDRIEAHSESANFPYLVLFKNSGAEAGATLAHSHAQLIATPIVPRDAAIRYDAAYSFQKKSGNCLFCTLWQEELQGKERVAFENEDFVAFFPYASRSPYQLLLVPKRHQAGFTQLSKTEVASLADILAESLAAFDRLLRKPPFNMIIHTTVDLYEQDAALHWYIELLPKLYSPAGFELGSGLAINPVAPELAARQLLYS